MCLYVISLLQIRIVDITLELTTEDKALNHTNTSLPGEGCIPQQKHASTVVAEALSGKVKFAAQDSAEENTSTAPALSLQFK